MNKNQGEIYAMEKVDNDIGQYKSGIRGIGTRLQAQSVLQRHDLARDADLG
jgi:hypothetical protein